MDDQEAPPQWFTESQRGEWKVGDRVRVSLDECRFHGTREAGITGTVYDIDAPNRWQGAPAVTHPYLVWFDRPLTEPEAPIEFWYYAAGELRRFDPLAELYR